MSGSTNPLDRPATETPRDWTLRHRLGRWFVALSAIFVLLSAAMIVSLANFVATGDALIAKWQPAVSASERALADLVNQETGVRGYLLTGEARSLEPYIQYRAAVRRDLRRLQQGGRRTERSCRSCRANLRRSG